MCAGGVLSETRPLRRRGKQTRSIPHCELPPSLLPAPARLLRLANAGNPTLGIPDAIFSSHETTAFLMEKWEIATSAGIPRRRRHHWACRKALKVPLLVAAPGRAARAESASFDGLWPMTAFPSSGRGACKRGALRGFCGGPFAGAARALWFRSGSRPPVPPHPIQPRDRPGPMQAPEGEPSRVRARRVSIRPGALRAS
jgi:hypothetical protein